MSKGRRELLGFFWNKEMGRVGGIKRWAGSRFGGRRRLLDKGHGLENYVGCCCFGGLKRLEWVQNQNFLMGSIKETKVQNTSVLLSLPKVETAVRHIRLSHTQHNHLLSTYGNLLTCQIHSKEAHIESLKGKSTQHEPCVDNGDSRGARPKVQPTDPQSWRQNDDDVRF
ncbi:hypothetical protein H5410_029156 [Solanum commersonii]|uniref:Uncharacterized protein n=1 Tax=Solanum commersonii TaxID=4109 RepID=A0A9J5Z6U6_SOLCO|nr:hypothetical protein H5410_029156 [Solanum commersonii]